ncbi:hypothetical protein [Hydrocarboniphaga sp.]|uniref:hypothetical protein n=1 Tax=Hydrocarboniphaga sp. TaxID=2033016 RepID=UPI003D096F99
MQLKFAVPAAVVVATAAYLWLLNQVGQRPQHSVAAKAPATDAAPAAQSPPARLLLPEPLPARVAATPASPTTAAVTQNAEALPEAADSGDGGDEDPPVVAGTDPVELSLLLQNGSEPQRLGALREAAEAGTTLPMAMLQQALRYDRSERVRAGVLDYLAESGSTRRSDLLDAVAIAERDADPAIQARARELRGGLHKLALAEAGAEEQQQSAASYR